MLGRCSLCCPSLPLAVEVSAKHFVYSQSAARTWHYCLRQPERYECGHLCRQGAEALHAAVVYCAVSDKPADNGWKAVEKGVLCKATLQSWV